MTRESLRGVSSTNPASAALGANHVRPDDPAGSSSKRGLLLCPRCKRTFPSSGLGVFTHCPDDRAPLMRASDLPAIDADPMIGRVLDGRFTLVSKLGAGSMGTVYRARQHAIGRDVAVKILRSDRAMDETSKARFLREARANSVLHSPNTVTVFDFGQSESGEFYLAMEMLEGESLGQRLARVKRLPIEAAVETTRQALRSLAEAHAKGIIHRDLKPDNLFFAKVMQSDTNAHEEIVKVLDFGIAKLLRDEDSPISPIETQAGTVFGTPRYMSPEQAQGKTLDPRSDLYSLAVILYQMIAGRAPFTDSDAIVVMARHIKTLPKPPSETCPEAHISPEIEAVLMRALSKDPKARQDNADAFSRELAKAMEASGSVVSGIRSSIQSISLTTPAVPAPTSTEPMMSDGPAPSLQLDEVGATAFNPVRRRRKIGIAFAGIVLSIAAAATTLVMMQAHRHEAHGVTGVLLPPKRTNLPLPTTGPVLPKSAAAENDGLPSVSLETLPRVPAPSFAPGSLSSPRQAHPNANASVSTPPNTNTSGASTRTPAPIATAPTAPSPPPTPVPSSTYGIFE